MRIPFIVFIRALGLYALISIPALIFPIMYFISIVYVVTYGWFAWGLFTCIYLLVKKSKIDFDIKQLILYFGVALSVLFAFQMIEVFGTELNIWNSGPFLLFPVVACMAGWASLSITSSKEEDYLVAATAPEEADETDIFK